MTYIIQINYSSGDSGGSWDEDGGLYYFDKVKGETIYPEFSNIEVAKENLKRIKEHYLFCKSYDRSSWENKYLPPPDYITRHFPNCVQVVNYGKRSFKQLLFDATFYLPILLDDGTEVLCSANWNGYFESLKRARITQKEEDGWSFEL